MRLANKVEIDLTRVAIMPSDEIIRLILLISNIIYKLKTPRQKGNRNMWKNKYLIRGSQNEFVITGIKKCLAESGIRIREVFWDQGSAF